MNFIEKALKFRESIPREMQEPLDVSQKRLLEPGRILLLIEKHAKDNSTIFEARRQYIICLCSSFEIYWRTLLKSIIDSHELTEKQLKKTKEIKLSLFDLRNIVGHKLTLGELFTSVHVFQSPYAVNSVVSDMLGNDAFSEFAKAEFKLGPFRNRKYFKSEWEYVKGSDILKDLGYLEECFEVRHDSAHSSGSKHVVSAAKLDKFSHAVNYFCFFFGLFIRDEIEKNTKIEAGGQIERR
jgi:hypothetical protein